jgi:hypothetical protein
VPVASGVISINYSRAVLQRRGPHVSFTTPSPSRFDCALVVRFSLPPDPISEGPSGGDRPSLASTTISALPSAMYTFTSPLHQSLGDHPSAFPNQYGKSPSLPTRYLLLPFTFSPQLHHPPAHSQARTPILQALGCHDLCLPSLSNRASGTGHSGGHSCPETQRGTLLLSVAADHLPMRGKREAREISAIVPTGR